jgi:hypothetical protein
MNDYVKQLCEQAEFVFWKDEPWGPGTGRIDWANDYTEGLNKLVESVVKECARIAELKEQGAQDFDKDVSVGWYMRQRFGVK